MQRGDGHRALLLVEHRGVGHGSAFGKKGNLPSIPHRPVRDIPYDGRLPDYRQEKDDMTYELIQVRTEGERAGVITLNRPKQLNALNDALMDELGAALQAFDADPAIGCMVVTGSEKAFAAGADIGAMASYSFADVYKGDYITRNWEQIRQIRKPVIAAVSGFALGGGCELAMMCDFIIAADNARFGQPEIKLGIIPGAGGTQRLPRAVGKAKAMDMALTGRMMDATEAERAGLVSRVVPLEKLMDEALGAALMICDYSQVATMAAKESVNKAFEGSLADGIHFERRLFHALFATDDQKEGMDAFVNKRKAVFKNR
jgi:enoyl-CoA hydratase